MLAVLRMACTDCKPAIRAIADLARSDNGDEQRRRERVTLSVLQSMRRYIQTTVYFL
jgi:hypothetical protein